MSWRIPSKADDGLVASLQTEKSNRVFNVFIDLFDRVGLTKNVHKMVRMACRPCYTPGKFSESSYMWQVTGIAPSYRERLWWRWEFP